MELTKIRVFNLEGGHIDILAEKVTSTEDALIFFGAGNNIRGQFRWKSIVGYKVLVDE